MRTDIEVSVTGERLPLPTGGTLAATLFRPEEPRAAAVVHPATATPARFYTAFATFLASRGYATVTYDYRGTGASGKPRDNRDVRMRDWMLDDAPAAAAWARARFPDVPQVAVGHSVGGHALLLGRGSEGLRGFVTVASHAGVTRTVPDARERARVAAVLHVLGPGLGRLLGYVPGAKMGLGEDMPTAAMIEWGDWARRPNYFFDDPSMLAAGRSAGVTSPVLAIGLSDDPWATPAQVDAVHAHLTSTRVERRTYTPADAGVPTLGHHGFFRRGGREGLWGQVGDWFDARIADA